MTKGRGVDVYRGRDPREVPAYGLVEASHYLRLPEQTIRQWLYGRPLPSGKVSKPLVYPASPATYQLSFVNLLELHVLSAIRRQHKVNMRKVRQAIDELEKQFNSPHPLIDQEMLTDGTDIFVDSIGQLVNLNQHGQYAMREILSAYLRRIERNEAGLAIRLYPFTRRPGEDTPRIIAIDPRLAFGRPVIAGTRIPTAEVAERFKAGDSIDDLLREYDASASQIHEAIRCELQTAA
jgi:uncharacterized protein (DUF433 family)